MREGYRNRAGTAKRGLLLLSLLALFSVLVPLSSSAFTDCSVPGWTSSPGECKTDCIKSGVLCKLADAKSWASNNTNLCLTEALQPADPPNGSYFPPMNCNNNTWPLQCNAGFTGGERGPNAGTTGHCSATACHPNVTVPNCAVVDQCANSPVVNPCITCDPGFTACTGACTANITIDHCATYNQCAMPQLCTSCNPGYELVGNVCVGATLKLSKDSVNPDKTLSNSPEPAIVYITADGKVGVSTGNPSYQLHVASGPGETGVVMAVSTGTTDIFWVAGDGVHATKFFINGGDLTDLNASNLTSGTVPLARLLDLTSAQISATAEIQDTQLSTISTPGKIFDTALSPNVNLLDANQEITGIKTYFSSVTVTTALGAPRLELGENTSIAAEPLPDLGGGVTISTNVYVMGFASATAFYGDGSNLTGLAAVAMADDAQLLDGRDSLDYLWTTGDLGQEITGNKTFLSSVTVTTALGAPRLELGENISISSETLPELGGGITVSTNMYIVGFASATKFYGDGSALTNMGGAGSNLDADTLDLLDSLDFVRTTGDRSEEVTGYKTFLSSLTVTTALGAPRFEMGEGVAISSETLPERGGGVTVSTNMYFVGFASAAAAMAAPRFELGEGVAISSETLPERGGGVTVSTNMYFVGFASAAVAVGAPRFELGEGVAISSETLPELGGGVTISSNVYIIGFASAATALAAPRFEMGEGVAISSETLPELGGGVTISSNVYIIGFASAAAAMAAPRFELGEGVAISSETLPELGGGVTISSNVYIVGFASAAAAMAAPRFELGEGVAISSETLPELGGGVTISSNVYIIGFASAAAAMAAPRFELGEGVAISSETLPERGGGVTVSTNMYFVGFASAAVAVGAPRFELGEGVAISSETLPELGGGVTISSNVYIIGFASAAAAMAAPRFELGEGVAISSETLPELGGGVTISSNVYIMGFSSATAYYGDGSHLYGLAADISENASLLDGLDSTDFVRRTGFLTEEIDGDKTFVSSVTVTTVLGAPRFELAEGVAISSETLPELGGGITVSTNMYVVGFASASLALGAPRFEMGEGVAISSETLPERGGGVTVSTNMYFVGFASAAAAMAAPRFEMGEGVAISSETLPERGGGITVSTNMYFVGFASAAAAMAAPRFELGEGVAISSEALPELGGGVTISSNVYIVGFASAAVYYGDGSKLTLGGDGSGLNADKLDGLHGPDYVRRTDYIDEDITGVKHFVSSVTFATALGAPRLELGDNVTISSEPLAEFGGGVTVSTNMYVVGFASAAKFYGDGSTLTGLGGEGSGLNADLFDTLNSTDFVRTSGYVSEDVTGNKTFVSSMTITTLLGVPRIELAEGVAVSSGPDGTGGVAVSTDVNIAGVLSAARFVGDASGLTSVPGDSLGTHVATTTLSMAGFDIVNVSTMVISSITTTMAGVTFSTNVYIWGDVGIGTTTTRQKVDVAGKVRATGFCIGENCQIGTLGIYTGATTLAYNGARGGYAAANALCDAEFTGSHICTNGEILFSINMNQFSFPFSTTLWISNGPPGYTVNANDCNGWNDSNNTSYGPVWNRLASGEGFGTLSKCDGVAMLPRQFACCK